MIHVFKRLTSLITAATMLCIYSVAPVFATDLNDKSAIRGAFPYWAPVQTNDCTAVNGTGGSITVEGHKFDLPATSGYSGNEDSIGPDGVLVHDGGHVAFSNLASNNKYGDGGKSLRDYAINMRWTFVAWYWDGGSSGILDQAQLNWMRSEPRLVKVTNPRTHKSVITAILESGPAPWTGVTQSKDSPPEYGWQQPQTGTPAGYKGRVAGLTPIARDAIGAIQGENRGAVGDVLLYEWANQETDRPGTVTDGSNATVASLGGCVNGAQVNVDGYAWPIGLGKETSDNGWSRTGLGWPCLTFCHHDGTPAFDIAHTDTVKSGVDSATAGTPIYAIFNGKLANVGPYHDIPGCLAFQVEAEDGFHYWYGHLSPTPGKPIQAGQHVKAGDQVAVVGVRKCTGNGSYPHLHIDRGAPKGADGGYDCCRDKGFVPLMNGLYAGLTK